MKPAALALLLLLAGAAPASAGWPPPGADLTRPRILYAPGQEDAIRARLEREPYRTIVAGMVARAAEADGIALGDDLLTAHRIKARAAKVWAFLYAMDRTFAGGAVVPFASPAEREAAGDQVRDWLLHLFPHDRLTQPPPLGNWDRDISTSEELLQYATAYDTLVGGGYALAPGDRAEIESRLAQLAGELHRDYLAGEADIHQNNHRAKSGASLVVAAIALAEHTPVGGRPHERDPAEWARHGLDLQDEVMRWSLGPGDGAYGEGPFYLRFALENLIPFARAWDRFVGGARWPGPSGFPSPWRDPRFRRSLRWALDMTLPDGSLVHQDDGNVARFHYFGAFPPDHPDTAAFYWRWATAERPWEASSNVDLGPDTAVLYDDTIDPAPPGGSPTSFYEDGGNAIFRSDWSREGVVAVVQGERDEAASFGRDRLGLGVGPQSHEHAEPGAFLLHAFGERLALDPGYISFSERQRVGLPEHHNVILVDGNGPVGFLGASFLWSQSPRLPRPPADGQATLYDTWDTDFLDAARVVTRYGSGWPQDPYPGSSRVERRFLFADDAYLAIADRLGPEPGAVHDYTWLVHGNGGGEGDESGGSFLATPTGGRWTRPAARLDAGVAVDAGIPALSSEFATHEGPDKAVLSHTVLRAEVGAGAADAALLVYPTPIASAPPTLERLALDEGAGLRLIDADGDRRVAFVHRRRQGRPWLLPEAETGLPETETTGRLALFDAHLDGTLRLAWAEGARALAFGDVVYLASARAGTLGIRPADGRADLVVANGAPEVRASGLAFAPTAADGACALALDGGDAVLALGRERRVTLRADGPGSAPGADPGPERHGEVGDIVELDASASCDADGDALTPTWALASAPPGSDRLLEDPGSIHPRLHLDRPGVYRLDLVVTDATGRASRPQRVRVLSGPECGNGLDDDLDGRIDTDDEGCADPGRGEACGLGFELALVLAVGAALRRRRRP